MCTILGILHVYFPFINRGKFWGACDFRCSYLMAPQLTPISNHLELSAKSLLGIQSRHLIKAQLDLPNIGRQFVALLEHLLQSCNYPILQSRFIQCRGDGHLNLQQYKSINYTSNQSQVTKLVIVVIYCYDFLIPREYRAFGLHLGSLYIWLFLATQNAGAIRIDCFSSKY